MRSLQLEKTQLQTELDEQEDAKVELTYKREEEAVRAIKRSRASALYARICRTSARNTRLGLELGVEIEMDSFSARKVTAVDPDSLAFQTGIRSGDFLERINDQTVDDGFTDADLRAIMGRVGYGDWLHLQWRREDRQLDERLKVAQEKVRVCVRAHIHHRSF